jgi:HemY protein
MFWIVAILLFFIVGVATFELIKQDSGYVLISLNGVSVETSFWFAIFTVLVLALLLYIVLFSFGRIFSAFSDGTHWIKRKRAMSIDQNYRHALLHFLTGEYKSANRFFETISKKNDLPVVKAIASAHSLSLVGNNRKAIEILQAAEQSYPHDAAWILKAMIDIQLSEDESEQVLKNIEKLKLLAPNDPFVQKAQYQALPSGSEKNVATLELASEKKLQFSNDEADDLLLTALRSCSEKDNVDSGKAEQLWSKADSRQKADIDLQLAYARALKELNQLEKLKKFVEKTLRKQWNAGLIDLFVSTDFGDIDSQISLAQSWKKTYSNEYELFIALGVLLIKNQIWGQARSYLLRSLELQENSKALCLLGYISERLDDKEESFNYYKRAAECQVH